jgi:SAM-dependent methyltransferase
VGAHAGRVKFAEGAADVRVVLNWLARYAAVIDHVVDADGHARTSVLDVGCGPHGLACAVDGVPFVGVDVEFPQPVAPTMVGIRCRPEGLPFRDGAFGVVLCLDVLEHVPAADRAGFVRELARVAAERVILACPSSDSQAIDDLLVTTFQTAGTALPPWLTEHYDCGLPTPAEIAGACAAVDGFRATPLAMPNGLLTTATTLAELTGPLVDVARHEAAALRDAWVTLYRNACFGESGRKGWVLERIAPRVPLADPDDLEATAIAALRCPECDGAVTVERPDLLRCGACDLPMPRDDTRAWDLASPPAFFCAPAWRDGDVQRLLRRFVDQRRGPASLVLYAPPEVIDGAAALRAAQAAFGDAPVPEALDIAILDRALPADELSALRAGRTVLVA